MNKRTVSGFDLRVADVCRLMQGTGGTVFVGKWTPGDGWSRYSIEQHNSENSGVHDIARGMNRKQFEAFINGAWELARIQGLV